MTYRVIQWATGSIGKTCLRAVLDSPDCESVGLRVHSDRKVGEDAGAIARRRQTGAVGTTDVEEISALDADVVIHAPRLQVPYEQFDDELCRLLRSGKNVITTAGNHYPEPTANGRTAPFEQACADGQNSLFGVGVSPGVIGERIAMTLASTSLELEAIDITEVLEASGMVSPGFVFTVMGMGIDPAEVDLLAGPLPGLYRTLYSETLVYMADHLGLTGYVIEDDHHFELAPADTTIRAGLIRAGTVAATAWRWHLRVDGVTRLTLAIIWTMDSTLPRYAGRPHWQIRMSGKAELSMSIDLHDPVDSDVRTTSTL